MLNPFSSLPAVLLCVTLPLTAALPLLPSNHMVIAKMSIYKRMRRACCFDCGRSERDCSCMSGRVRGNVDTLERAFPLSSVSVNDCSTSFRACKFNLDMHPMSVLSVVSSLSRAVPRGSVSQSAWCHRPSVICYVVTRCPSCLCPYMCWGGHLTSLVYYVSCNNGQDCDVTVQWCFFSLWFKSV